MLRSRPASGIPSPFGELLVSGGLLHHAVRPFSSAVSRLTWDIPHGLALQGLEVHAQGLCRASTSTGGGKTLHIQAQLTNALDLWLGF